MKPRLIPLALALLTSCAGLRLPDMRSQFEASHLNELTYDLSPEALWPLVEDELTSLGWKMGAPEKSPFNKNSFVASTTRLPKEAVKKGFEIKFEHTYEWLEVRMERLGPKKTQVRFYVRLNNEKPSRSLPHEWSFLHRADPSRADDLDYSWWSKLEAQKLPKAPLYDDPSKAP